MSNLCTATLLPFLLTWLILTNLTTAGNGAPPSAGFSLPLMSNHHELNNTADGFGYMQRLQDQAASRVRQLLPPSAVNLTWIRPPMGSVVWPSYSVLVGVGSGHAQHFYRLALDMAGGLTWMQCEPCIPHLPQESPVFDSDDSHHFQYIEAVSRYCRPPYNPVGHDRCSFDVTFGGALAHGYLGSDMFTFATGNNGLDAMAGIVFGCAHTTNRFENHNTLAGVFSMNKHQTSFIKQIGRRVLWRFSYCLSRQGHAHRHGFLRFGGDVPHQPHAQSTAIMYPRQTGVTTYHIRVVGVSVNGQRLSRVIPRMFQGDRYGRGGSIIDVGMTLTTMIHTAYDIVENAVAAHLQRHGAQRVSRPGHRLCIRATSAIRAHLPSMALHFYEETSLVIKPEVLFMMVSQQDLCFAVVPSQDITVLGAMQQVDTRFTFDLRANTISFVSEQCHLDTGP